jgi:hypothetical protein
MIVIEPQYEAVWPLGRRHTKPVSRRVLGPLDLNGKTVAFIWNYRYRGNDMFQLIQSAIEQRYTGTSFVGPEVFGDIHGTDERQVISALPGHLVRANVDVAVVAVGASGTCAPAVARACAVAEETGISCVAIADSGYRDLLAGTAAAVGIPYLPLATYPGLISSDSAAVFDQKVRDMVVPGVLNGLTAAPNLTDHAEHEPSAREVVATGTLDEILSWFHQHQWTDGLPIVPPTLDRISAFLEFTHRDPGEVLGVLPPDMREATVWNVAVNGVMAGCRPEYLPVLLAAVEAIAEPEFRLEHAGSTVGWEPLVILSTNLSGPLNLNSGAGAMRVGRQANSSIGRFLRLYMLNVAGLRIPPGVTDRGALGYTFNVALTEDDLAVKEIGWPPFRVDRGFAPDDDIVTVQSVVNIGPPIYSGGSTPESHLEFLTSLFASSCGPWSFSGVLYGRWHPLVVMSPFVAGLFGQHGWTKDDIRRHLRESARIPAGTLERYLTHIDGSHWTLKESVDKGRAPSEYATSTDPDRLVPMCPRADWINIVVAGDAARNQSRVYVNNHEQGPPISKRIKLPERWSQLLEGGP